MSLPLTFRGIPFLWDERGGENTPRFAEHDWPQKKGRNHEDMARGPFVYSVSGWLIADSTLLAYAKLRVLQKACADQRPGTLTHPIFGAVRVVNTGFKWKESREKRNRIDVDLTFEEDIAPQNPASTRWLGAALSSAIDSARDAIGGALDQVWNLVQLPLYAISDAEDALADVAAQVFGTLGLLTSPVQSNVSGFASLLSSGTVETSGLSVPMVSMFSSYTTDDYGNPLQLTADQANATARAMTPLATFTLPAEPTNTPSRAIVAQAMDGLAATVRRLALLELANVTRQRSFVSSTDAIGTRDSLADMMDAEILAAADEASIDSNPVAADVSRALNQVRAEMITDLTVRAASLKPVGTISLSRTTSATALAYALYGDGEGTAGDRANTLLLVQDLLARNAITDPGQLPGGVPLEYLAAG
jgi:prophage DNA circulation protein